MQPNNKAIVGIIILGILLALAGFYIYNNSQDFKQLYLVNPIYLVILILLFILSYFIIGLVTKNLLLSLGISLKGFEAFALSIITGFYNLITPFRGGMAVRAIYLKKKHDFAYTDFLATLSGMYVLTFLVASFTGIITALIIYFNYKIFSWVIFLIFSAIFFPLLLIVIFSPKLSERRNKWANRFVKVINGWHLIKDNYKVILIVSILSALQLFISAFMLSLQFHVFGIEISFVKSLFLVSIGSLSILIAITPANLGIAEAVAVFSALTLGITPAQSLPVALLGRVVQIIILFILGPIFSYNLIRRKNRKNI